MELTTPSNQRQVLEEEKRESKDSNFIKGISIPKSEVELDTYRILGQRELMRNV